MSSMLKAISGVVCLWCLCGTAVAEVGTLETPGKAGDVNLQEKLEKIQREIRGHREMGRSRPNLEKVADPGRVEEASLIKIGIQMTVCLGFIIILAIVSLRLLKWFQKSDFLKSKGGGGNSLEVLETCYLGKDQKVVLMRMDGQRAFLGVTPHGIQSLEMPETIAHIRPKPSSSAENTPENFSRNLDQFLSNFKKPKTVTQSLAEM